MRALLHLACVLLVPTAIVVAVADDAAGHEEKAGGGYRMTLGWAEEPAFVGFPNAVSIRLTDGAGRPITDLGDTLKAEVVFAEERLGPSALQPNPGVPGEYRLPIVPTRPGNYTFRFTGSVRGEKVEVSSTSSETTFDPVRAAGEIQFPARDPSMAELADRIERLGPRLERTLARAEERASDADRSKRPPARKKTRKRR